jgi:hypothetical protein
LTAPRVNAKVKPPILAKKFPKPVAAPAVRGPRSLTGIENSGPKYICTNVPRTAVTNTSETRLCTCTSAISETARPAIATVMMRVSSRSRSPR